MPPDRWIPNLLRDRRAFRRWLGGTWFLVAGWSQPDGDGWWVRRPTIAERVIRVERYGNPPRTRVRRGRRQVLRAGSAA